MRKIFFFAILLISLTSGARDFSRGYRGFVDFDNAFGGMTYHDAMSELTTETQWFIGVSTAHGYQFNRHIFAGGGLLLQWAHPSLEVNLPVFVVFRYDLALGRFSPFCDVRLGYDIPDPSLYFSPTVGCTLVSHKKKNFNVGAGLMLRSASVDTRNRTQYFFALRLGFDF